MRYALIAAAAAALISTGAMAQEMNTSAPQQGASTRAYAPATPTTSRANAAFQQQDGTPAHEATVSEQDRLFLMQGDRGLGNG